MILQRAGSRREPASFRSDLSLKDLPTRPSNIKKKGITSDAKGTQTHDSKRGLETVIQSHMTTTKHSEILFDGAFEDSEGSVHLLVRKQRAHILRQKC